MRHIEMKKTFFSLRKERASFSQKSFLAACFFVFAVFMPLGAEADGTRWYVTQNGGTVTKDGTSWETAYGEAEFPAAIQSAQEGDEIWVAEGAYRPVIPADSRDITTDEKNATFQLQSGVALYGGFTGNETTRDARDWQNNVTVLTGDLAGDDTKATLNGGVTVSADYIVGTNSDTVVIGSGTDDTAVLDGFTLCGGNKGTLYGGVNYAGGGMYNDAGNPTVTNCTFSGNNATSYGGGMYNDGGSNPIVSNCTFSGNNSGYGGGMHNRENSSPTVSNCTFSGNNVTTYGGGMYNKYSSPTITNCTFSQNNSERGGGMCNGSSSPTVSNCTFSQNNATTYGGGIYNYISSPTITNCTFSGNNASDGGGMNNFYNSSPTITNCTFSGNTTDSGGGIFNWFGSPTLTNCIFWGDKAGNTGNEIMNENNSNPTVTYCVVEGGYAGDENLDTNPFLGPLQDNGGSTKTRALGTNSSAIGNGTSAGIWQNISLDQRGIPRDDKPDIGAYEYRSDLKILTVDVEGSGKVLCNPVGISLGSSKNQWCYNVNTSVTLEAFPNFPWIFTEWSGDVSGTAATATVSMNENHRVNMVFTRQWGIVASAGTGGTIAPSGNITVAPGSDQTFTVTPEGGYAIEDVRVDGTSQGAETTYTFTNVTEDHTIAASFAVQPTSTPIPPVPTATTTPAPSGTPGPAISPQPLQGDIEPGVTIIPVPNEEDPVVRELKEELENPESDARKALENTIREQVQAALEQKLGRKIDLENMQVNVHTSDAYRFEEVPLNKDDGTGTVIVPVEITYREPGEERVKIFFTLVLVYDLATNPPTPLEYRVVMLEEGENASLTDRDIAFIRAEDDENEEKIVGYLRVRDQSEYDGNPQVGVVSTKYLFLYADGAETATPTPGSASGGGGGCGLGFFPLALLLALPLMLLKK